MVARSGMVQPSWANDHVVYDCKIRFGGALGSATGKNKCHRRSDARARKGILSLSSNSSLPSEGQHGALHQNYLHASIPCTELRAMYACHHCLRANYPQGGIRREVSELTHLTTLVLSSNLLKGMMRRAGSVRSLNHLLFLRGVAGAQAGLQRHSWTTTPAVGRASLAPSWITGSSYQMGFCHAVAQATLFPVQARLTLPSMPNSPPSLCKGTSTSNNK
ncbi:uncharacterized protein LOC119314255 [Triticum dicoccoides]|uniref:uncharacterized protein LOC119314255 n=1 Tax=Triticum dicoccoides TaxID=85692 RepID=UPI001891C6A8|nr:uncharacterized protein LOC119314255 [Triticum dicoccoides]